jgi:LacI family transcriptional regulator
VGIRVVATIREVAKRAGVSPITVSRVINNTSYVSAETRARVEATIAELQYVPNKLAQSLRQKQTNTLALLVTDITNPFWTTVARGVEDVVSERGMSVFLCNTDESESKQNTYLNLVLQKQVDGILLVPVNNQCEAILRIQAQNIPVVVMDRKVTNAQVDVVRCDSEGGAYELVRHLLEQGHRQIALLNGAINVFTAIDRANGYRRALREAQLDINAEQIYHGEFTLASGYDMAQLAINAVPRPTALFAATNFIAIGALRALRDAGLHVPEDMVVVGFDDLPEEIVIEPFLTVAAQPAYEMGQQATELLLTRITEGAAGFQEIILPTELRVRASSCVRVGRHDR